MGQVMFAAGAMLMTMAVLLLINASFAEKINIQVLNRMLLVGTCIVIIGAILTIAGELISQIM